MHELGFAANRSAEIFCSLDVKYQLSPFDRRPISKSMISARVWFD